MKAKLALLEASPYTSQSSKPFQSKNKGLVAETFDWDEEEVSDDEEKTQVKVLMDLAADELSVGKNHARNGEWIDITMKKANTKPKKKILGDEQLTESSSQNDGKENPFIPAPPWIMTMKWSKNPKTWLRDSTLTATNFNTGRILVLESQTINECLQLTKTPNDPESSKESGLEPQTPLPLLKNLQVASLSSEVMTLTYQDHSPRERSGLGTMKHRKPETQESLNKNVFRYVTISNTEPVTSSVPNKVKINDQESKIDELTKLVQMLMDEKINSTQKIQEPKPVSSQP
ncbi:hypothetical protein Tco_1122847 [Tanacetum coccineum]|uniref:Retrovirus-related Pol polyprotein from transposon TNT 1-94 n=1 Tax=Tanacetum coccineum TaxID=301880 RepID=A0ABQ5J1N9_9ASTR